MYQILNIETFAISPHIIHVSFIQHIKHIVIAKIIQKGIKEIKQNPKKRKGTKEIISIKKKKASSSPL